MTAALTTAATAKATTSADPRGWVEEIGNDKVEEDDPKGRDGQPDLPSPNREGWASREKVAPPTAITPATSEATTGSDHSNPDNRPTEHMRPLSTGAQSWELLRSQETLHCMRHKGKCSPKPHMPSPRGKTTGGNAENSKQAE